MNAQEASSGFELRSTLSAISGYSSILGTSPRDGSDYMAGGRAVLYPTWKISSNWAISAAIQAYTRPYFIEQFDTQGYGAKVDLLQAHLSYTRFFVGGRNSVVVRVGQLSSAFGSYLLRYDDAANPLINMPQAYGYYYKGVTTLGLAGAQVDVVLDKLDLRAQFTNSSPSNRRSVFDSDQYGSWTAGAGYTIKQGLRVGSSFNWGPYLHRQHRFFRVGEAAPHTLSEFAWGIDGQYGAGAWNIIGEYQVFNMPYKAAPDFIQKIGYGEVRRTLHPRWYVAGRAGRLNATTAPNMTTIETTVGFRPNRFQLVKFSYIAIRNARTSVTTHTAAVQLVTTPDAITLAR